MLVLHEDESDRASVREEEKKNPSMFGEFRPGISQGGGEEKSINVRRVPTGHQSGRRRRTSSDVLRLATGHRIYKKRTSSGIVQIQF
jgi:hypothetical protein